MLIVGKKNLENLERMLKERLKHPLSKPHKNHCYYFGGFGLKICIAHVFISWLLLGVL